MERIEIDAYVVDTLMADLVGHDRQPSAFLVYMQLWRRTQGEGERRTRVSLNELAELTGLSRRSVQDALALLHRRRLISIRRESITAVAEYSVLRPWRRQ